MSIERGTSDGRVRIAAVADLHFTRTSRGSYEDLFARVSEEADVLLLCGDLTDYGLPEEGELLTAELEAARLPVVAVLGNHDYEADAADELKAVLVEAGVVILDGDTCELEGIGFAGVKGFAGGFGRGSLKPWGEGMIKAFVQEAVDEQLKLEAALARLRTERRVVLLHYAPVLETVQGEPPEIFPFLGSSRLAEPLERYPVDAVLHGHAHLGSLEGTVGESAVYNVSLPLLRQHDPEGPPYLLLRL